MEVVLDLLGGVESHPHPEFGLGAVALESLTLQNEGWQRLQVEVTSGGKPIVFQVAFFPDKAARLDVPPLDQW